MDPKEIEINVPWGIIAGKTWGLSTNPVVLLLHGIMDNAGSFDYLVPLLASEYYYVSIDLPGHGMSSHISIGLTIQAVDYIFVLKLITEHFGREKYIIIGHSFGAALGLQFGLIYPEKLDILFTLDALWFIPVNPKEFISWSRNSFDEFTKFNNIIRRNRNVQVTYDEAVEISTQWRDKDSELNPKARDALLKRSLAVCSNGKFRLTRDLRLNNYMPYPFDDTYALGILSSNKLGFDMVSLLGEHGNSTYSEKMPKYTEFIKKIGRLFMVDGKSWGSNTNPTVLLFHGLLDNAGSFDYLIPLLPYGYYYVSIDLPGHGKSSHISTGLTLQAMDYIFVVKLITDYFDKNTYIIMGHSFGAILGLQFSLIYPERVEILFIMDTLWFEVVEPNQFRSWMRNKFDEFIKINDKIAKNMDVTVTYDQAVELMTTYRYVNCELTPEATNALLKRSLIKCADGKYKFTRDLRLGSYMGYPTDARYVSELLASSKISSRIVILLTKHNEAMYRERSPKVLDCFKKLGEWFIVDGNHHVHLNKPELISPIINSFLEDNSYPV